MLATIASAALAMASLSAKSPERAERAAENARVDAAPLSFHELFEPSPHELKPSAKLLALHGKRVRMVGYMVRMEDPPRGAFYLTPRPVTCDEGGAGTGDLPPEAVLVTVHSRRGQEIPFDPRLLEVTGVLGVGSRVEENGRVSAIRLSLERPPGSPRPGRAAKPPAHPSPEPSNPVAR